MASLETATRSSASPHWFPRTVALVGGVAFVGFGAWAMLHPRSFFDFLATFPPYNQHFVQDVGAFEIGLGVVLLLAGMAARPDALAVALLGVGVGAALHTVSHIVGNDLGGTPELDIPLLAALSALLLAGGAVRWKQHRNRPHHGTHREANT